MKQFTIILIICLFCFGYCFAQEGTKKSRKQIRAEKTQQKSEKIIQVIKSKDFIFEATHANPLTGGSIFLNSYYELHIKNDSAYCCLPFFGVAYQVEYGSREGGIKFKEKITDYSEKFEKNKFSIHFKVYSKRDNYSLSLTSSTLGYATLVVNSNNRQSINFSGIIKIPKE